MDAFGWPHLLIILAVIVLLFGAARLPGVAKALGQSVRVFKKEMAASKAEDAAVAPPATPPAATSPAAGSADVRSTLDATPPGAPDGPPPRG